MVIKIKYAATLLLTVFIEQVDLIYIEDRFYNINCFNKNYLDYVGCFIDKDVRDLPYLAAGADNLMSTQKCIVYCRTAGYKYAAAQFGYYNFIK